MLFIYLLMKLTSCIKWVIREFLKKWTFSKILTKYLQTIYLGKVCIWKIHTFFFVKYMLVFQKFILRKLYILKCIKKLYIKMLFRGMRIFLVILGKATLKISMDKKLEKRKTISDYEWTITFFTFFKATTYKLQAKDEVG